jgi:hypothetical protein
LAKAVKKEIFSCNVGGKVKVTTASVKAHLECVSKIFKY